MQCTYLSKLQQQSAPVDRVSSLSSRDIGGLLLHVPSELGMLDREPQCRSPCLLSLRPTLLFCVPSFGANIL